MTYTMDRPTIPGQARTTMTADVQAVWDQYVRPDQEREVPPSGEMRVLMAILRATYQAYDGAAPTDTTLALPTPLVWPFGWEVDAPELVQECWDTFVGAVDPDPTRERVRLTLSTLLHAVSDAIRKGATQ